MKYEKTAVIAVVIGLVLNTSGAVRAHHAVFAYESDTVIELEGVLSAVRWGNPHIMLKLLVEEESGVEREWVLEGGTANNSVRRGFTIDDFRVGDQVRVAGRPSKSGRKELLVTNLLLPNGREAMLVDVVTQFRWNKKATNFETGSSETNLGRNIFRVWSFGKLYKARSPFLFTASAESARSTWNMLTDILALRCIAPGMPNAILNPYPIEFINEGNRILLKIEEWEAIRVIDMTSGEIPRNAPRSLLGYSVGRWEGETLVIETSRVDFPYLDDEGTPMSDKAHIIERFTVSEDGSRLNYELSVTDPENLIEPAVWDATWNWLQGVEIMPFECDTEITY